ncbi:MAG: 6-pyruvoyl-tetrahydropterin synthase-related protein [Faecalibacterium sp.]|nr:6-pyruvoyl-tetrahydropterin synthase-related protein [Faecalibacterium sp.]
MKNFPAEVKRRLTPAHVGLLLFFLCVVGLWFCQARSKDVYSNILIATPVSDSDAAADVSADAGKIVYSDEVDDLYPGTYHLEVNYQSTGSANRIEYVDLSTGEVLAGGTFAPDATYWDATLTLGRRVARLGMRSFLADGTLAVDSCYFTSVGPVYTDALWGLVLLAGLAGAGIALYRRFRAGRRYGLMLFLAGLAVSLPFVSDGLQNGHDICFHLSRIEGLAAGLLHGQLPVRLNETFLYGGGYLSSVMYPELFFYLPGALCAAGASVLCAYKVLCLFINLMTALCGYQGMRRIFGDKVGFAFALLYLLNPYRLDDLLLRAAIGEALAMAFLPLAAAGLYDLMQGNARRGFWEAILGISAVLQSHIISTVLLISFGGVYVLGYVLSHLRAYFAGGRRFAALCAAAVSTVLVNLWYIVPFLSYSRWELKIFTDQSALSKSAIVPFQAFLDIYHYSNDTPGAETAGEMPQTVGLVLLVAAVLFVLLCLAGKLEAGLRQKGTVCLLMGGFAWFMSSELFPWDMLQKLSLVDNIFSRFQFAWRFLIAAALLGSAVAAVVLVHLLENRRFVGAALMVCLAVSVAGISSAGYLQENPTLMLGKSSAWDHNITYHGQYLLVASDEAAVNARLAAGGVGCETAGVAVTDYQKTGLNLSFAFTGAGQDTVFTLPLYNYSMHRAFLDNGQELAVSSDANGLLCVTVPAGTASGTVQVRYYARRLFRVAELASCAAALGLVAGEILRHKKGVKPASA